MPAFRTAQPMSDRVSGHIEVSDELAGLYRANPEWVEVEPVGDVYVRTDQADAYRADLEHTQAVQDEVADLTGDRLDAAVKAAKIENPSTLTADEKRQALVEHRLQPAAEPNDFDTDPQES